MFRRFDLPDLATFLPLRDGASSPRSGWATPETPSPALRPPPTQHERDASEYDQRRRDRQQQHQLRNAAAPAAQIADRERHPSSGVEPHEPVAQQDAEARDQQYPADDATDDHRLSITHQPPA